MKDHRTIPENSLLSKEAHRYDYKDSFRLTLARTDVEPWELVAAFFQSAPGWVDTLFILRNKMVGLLGLKADLADVSKLNPPYETGRQFGLFKLLAINHNEAVLGEDDKHLNFRVSLLVDRTQENSLVVSTVVKINNRLGKAYFFVVKPFHRFIVPIMVKRMAVKINNKSLPQYKRIGT